MSDVIIEKVSSLFKVSTLNGFTTKFNAKKTTKRIKTTLD